MNKKNFAMNIANSAKVIIKRETMPFNVHANNKNWMSLIECVLKCGRILSAYIIFSDKRIQDDLLNAITNESITLHVSPNGWTDANIAVYWLKTVFHYHTKHFKKQLFVSKTFRPARTLHLYHEPPTTYDKILSP